MSGLEEVTFAALWTVFAILTLLLLMLYRQVDRAYRETGSTQSAPLLAGQEAPAVEVLDGERFVNVNFDTGRMTLLVFVSAQCEACAERMKDILSPHTFDRKTVVLVSGEGFSEYVRQVNDDFRIYWLAHPPDAMRSYGINRVPVAYMLDGRTIVASRVLASDRDLPMLEEEAEAVHATSAEAESAELVRA